MPKAQCFLNTFYLFNFLFFWGIALLQAQQIIHVIPEGSTTASGLSWTEAVNIERAFEIANPQDQIWVQNGDYYLANQINWNTNNLSLYGGFSGTENLLEERDMNNLTTFFDLENETEHRHFKISGNKPLIDGILFQFAQNGDNLGGGSIYAQGIQDTLKIKNCEFVNNNSTLKGGAIYLNNINCVIENSTIRENNATENGGAIYFFSGSLIMKDCYLELNHSDQNGGAIYGNGGDLLVNNILFTDNTCLENGGAISLNSNDAEIEGCEFSYNESQTSGGGAFISSGTANFTNCDFVENSSQSLGGAMFSFSSETFISDCLLNYNESQSNGGSIMIHSGNLTCNNSNFNFNHSFANGGAINVFTANLYISNSVFNSNSANINGGAIAHVSDNDLKIIDSEFYNNTSIVNGGAISAIFPNVHVDLNRVKFHNNSGYRGGAIYNTAELNIANALFNKNLASAGAGAIYNDHIANVTNSTFYKNAETAITIQSEDNETRVYNSIFYLNYGEAFDGANSEISGSQSWTNINNSTMELKNNIFQSNPIAGILENNLIGVDPLFVNAEGYYFNLAANSPAINNGLNSFFNTVSQLDPFTTTDLGGNSRVSQQIIDRGAYEFQDIFPVPPCTQMVIPSNGSTDISISTLIEWNAVSDATGYILQIGTLSGGSDILNEDVGNVTSYDLVVDLDYETTYYITIIPYNSSGQAENCEEFSFITETETIPLPSCTQLSNPLNAATEVSISTLIEWNAVTNATGYILQIGTSSGNSDILNEDVGNVTSYDLAVDLDYETTYYITIIPYNSSGQAENCEEFSFTTEIEELIIPLCGSLIFPQNNALDVVLDPLIEWNSVENATGYILQIGTVPGTSNILNEDVGNVTSLQLGFYLEYETTYYITLIPYSVDGQAQNCDEFSFTTESEPLIIPECTNIALPENETQNVTVETLIEWIAAPNATGYILQIGTSSGATDILNEDVGNVLNYHLSTSLEYSTTYYVSVIPYNENGQAQDCPEISFTTEPPPITLPECSTILVPEDGAVNISILSLIKWELIDDATGYILQIGTTPGSSDILNEDMGNVTSYENPIPWEYSTTYYITIIPYNDAGLAQNCSEYIFTTEPMPITIPDCTNILFPLNGSENVSIETMIEWEAVENATGYILQIGTSSGGSEILDENVGNVLSYQPNFNFEYNTLYYINIIAYNEEGQAENCQEFSFTTEEDPCRFSFVININGSSLEVIPNPASADYEYRLDEGTWQSSPLFSDLSIGVHTVEVRNLLGCIKMLTFEVIGESNFISPNGDGANDFIDYSFLMEREMPFMQIYDRYGKLIFEGNSENGYIWDGTIYGLPLPSTSYWVIAQWSDDSQIVRRTNYIVLKNAPNSMYNY